MNQFKQQEPEFSSGASLYTNSDGNIDPNLKVFTIHFCYQFIKRPV